MDEERKRTVPEDPFSFRAVAEDRRLSPLRKYQLLTLGTTRLLPLLRHELLLLLVNDLPGLAGIALRSRLYRGLFRALGRRVVLGRGLALRLPGKISIGDGAVIGDFCSFKVVGEEAQGISIGTGVFIGRFSSLNTRGGWVEILEHANISAHVRIGGYDRVSIGRHCIISDFCYIGGLNHRSDRTDVPIALQGVERRGGVVVGDDVWIGAGAAVLDGVRIGGGSIIGAGAVVTGDIPPYSVAVGVPARVVRSRRPADAPSAQDAPAAAVGLRDAPRAGACEL